MLRRALNVHVNWSRPITNTELYGGLPKVSKAIRRRKLKFTWQYAGSGKPARTYIDCLLEDTVCSVEEMKHRMKDRKLWGMID